MRIEVVGFNPVDNWDLYSVNQLILAEHYPKGVFINDVSSRTIYEVPHFVDYLSILISPVIAFCAFFLENVSQFIEVEITCNVVNVECPLVEVLEL